MGGAALAQEVGWSDLNILFAILCWMFLFVFVETGSLYIALAVLELIVYIMTTLVLN